MNFRIVTNKDVPSYKPLNTKASEVIVSSELQSKAVVTDKKSGSYVLQDEVVETSRVNTQEYIDSFKDDVGILNLMKKFDLCKDPSVFQQVTRATVPVEEDGKEVIQDYTGLPKTDEEALKICTRARDEFKALPSELIKGRSFEDFAESCTKDELLAFIASQNQKKEGEK